MNSLLSGGGNAQSLIIMLVLLVVMYFMLIRPQTKKDKEDKQMRNNLQVGDEIMTVGGIYGKIVRIREDRITIASGAEKTKLEITKTAIANKVTDTKAGKVVEDDKKSSSAASPKSIKKLGQKSEDTKEEAPAQETPAQVEAPAEPETQPEPVATEE